MHAGGQPNSNEVARKPLITQAVADGERSPTRRGEDLCQWFDILSENEHLPGLCEILLKEKWKSDPRVICSRRPAERVKRCNPLNS